MTPPGDERQGRPGMVRDAMCAEKCAYGTCGGSGFNGCGGCCGCRGGCVVAYENTLPLVREDSPQTVTFNEAILEGFDPYERAFDENGDDL